MKDTPFQIALKHEIERIERLNCSYAEGNHTLIETKRLIPTKNKNFLLHFFQPLHFLKSSTR
jgi:hypothetical protein